MGGLRGPLGAPVTPEYINPDGIGRRQHYEWASIYWSPTTGAYAIFYGPLWDTWAAHGWEQGLGYPVTDEIVNPDGIGRRQYFQYGQIYQPDGHGQVDVILPTSGAVTESRQHDANRCVHNVASSFRSQNTLSSSHIHGRLGTSPTDYRNNELNHNQGIGRLYHPDGRYVVLGRSMEGHAQLLMFKLDGYPSTTGALGSLGSHSTANRVVWQYNDTYDRNHPDGLSVMGNYFVHGISCEGGEKCKRAQNMPRVYVWDASNPAAPRRVLDFDLVNWSAGPGPSATPNHTATAGAATMVKLSDDQYLIIVKSKEYNPPGSGSERRVVRFLRGTSLTDVSTWSEVSVLPESSIDAWDDGDFNYQHISAVTECSTSKIFVVATKGDTWGSCDSDDSEVARLYELGANADGTAYTLSVVGHRYFHCTDAVEFGGAAGLYITDEGRLSFYTGEKELHYVSTGYKVQFREFWP
jgi:hypothetical protein